MLHVQSRLEVFCKEAFVQLFVMSNHCLWGNVLWDPNIGKPKFSKSWLWGNVSVSKTESPSSYSSPKFNSIIMLYCRKIRFGELANIPQTEKCSTKIFIILFRSDTVLTCVRHFTLTLKFSLTDAALSLMTFWEYTILIQIKC